MRPRNINTVISLLPRGWLDTTITANNDLFPMVVACRTDCPADDPIDRWCRTRCETVILSGEQQQHVLQSTPRRQASYTTMKRSVRFAEEQRLCSFCEGVDLEQLEKHRANLWYEQSELSHVKRKAMVVSKEAKKFGFGSLLTNTYGQTGEQVQEAINTWVRNGNSRRGLERWINEEYATKRSDLRRRAMQSVLRAQKKIQEEKVDDFEYAWKVIARLCEAFSADSRNFARAMGIADEEAAIAVASSGDDSTVVSASSMESAKSKRSLVSPSPRSVTQMSRGMQRSTARVSVRRNLGLTSVAAGEGEFRHFY